MEKQEERFGYLNVLLNHAQDLYVALTVEQISSLESQGNYASDWNNVLILKDQNEDILKTTLKQIRRCTFDGSIFINGFEPSSRCNLGDGINLPPGISDSTFSGMCYLDRNCLISKTTLVHNVSVGVGAVIVDCGLIVGGNGGRSGDSKGDAKQAMIDTTSLNLEVGAESGGRRLVVTIGMHFATICQQVYAKTCTTPKMNLTKDNQVQAFTELISRIPALSTAMITIVADRSTCIRCDKICHSVVGPGCHISSSTLERCFLNTSSSSDSIEISKGARLSHCILNEGSSVSAGCMLENVFMCEQATVGEQARVVESVLGPDASVAGGECHHSVLGPFVGFHHQSLLISAIWPHGRGNIAYGAKVGANHTGRVPDQESWPGEGVFFGLGCLVKFPCNLLESPYSIVVPGTVLAPQKISLPFSLISAADPALCPAGTGAHATSVKPGWVLYSNPYLVDRAAKKYSSRRKARQHRTDFPLFRPFVVELVRTARRRLQQTAAALQAGQTAAMTTFDAGAGLCQLTYADVKRAVDAYTDFVRRYALHGLLFAVQRARSHPQIALPLPLAAPVPTAEPLTAHSQPLQALCDDLELLRVASPNAGAIASSSEASVSFRLPYIITDSHSDSLLVHQLRVLTDEFPASGNADKSASVTSMPGPLGVSPEDLSHWATNPTTTVPSQVLALLVELCRLEAKHAEAVSSCRARDGTKGRAVIPDYDKVNAVGANVNADPVVKAAHARASDIKDVVSHLQL